MVIDRISRLVEVERFTLGKQYKVTPGQTTDVECLGVAEGNTVFEVVTGHSANAAIMFVPARFSRSAVLEAIDAGIKTLVVITEGIPQKDAIAFVARAKREGDVIIVGSNCPGLINPLHRIKVGIMPDHIFNPGSVGIASRSGALTYEIAWHISNVGLGQSICVGLGGGAQAEIIKRGVKLVEK